MTLETYTDAEIRYQRTKLAYRIASATNDPAVSRLAADMVRAYDALIASQD